jgi:hypothetical protein
MPPTGSIPEAGRMFFNAGRERSYRLARAGAIVTMKIGSKNMVALLHATAKKLGVDI